MTRRVGKDDLPNFEDIGPFLSAFWCNQPYTMSLPLGKLSSSRSMHLEKPYSKSRIQKPKAH